MLVRWIPRFGPWAASTRLRVYALHQALLESGKCESAIGPGAADVLIVQKAVEMRVLADLELFPGKLVYDFDDVIPGSAGEWAARRANLVTTDTPGRAAWFTERFKKPCSVLRDPIDYCPDSPLPAGAGHGAAWFGNWANFESSRWMALGLARAGFHIRVISEGTDGHPYEQVPWSLETFPEDLRRSAMAFLSHGGGDPLKSENKMVAAITLGVPCIVHGSASYAALAMRCGLPWAIVGNQVELQDAAKRLSDPGQRAAYLAAAQPLIWASYHPRVIAGQLLEMLEVVGCTPR